MNRNVRFYFENIVFDRNMEVSMNPETFEQVVRALVAGYGAIDERSQPVVEIDEKERHVKVRWPTVTLLANRVNADRESVVLSTRAPESGRVVAHRGREPQAKQPEQRVRTPEPEPDRPTAKIPEPEPERPTAKIPEPEPDRPTAKIPEPEQLPPEANKPKPELTEAKRDPEPETPPPPPQVRASRVRVCLLDEGGRPLAGRSFLWQPDRGGEEEGVTDDQGFAELTIAPTAGGRLTIFCSAELGDDLTWPVRAGDLSSVASPEGVRIRLAHLGFSGEATPSGGPGAETLARFQRRFGLMPGPLDDRTRDLLARAHRDTYPTGG